MKSNSLHGQPRSVPGYDRTDSRKRRILFFTNALASTLMIIGTAFSTAAEADEQTDFRRDIRPILSNTCFQCHGPDESSREADLRLDQPDQLSNDRGGYRIIEAGKPASSELWKRITSRDPATVMPPPDSGKELDDSQRERLKQWIEDGAVWSRHWAYQKPVRWESPPIRNQKWSQNWIDAFILNRIEKAGQQPVADADPITLVRRLSFDLTGLPPRPEWVASMREDASPGNTARLIDEMLDNDGFGERLAVYWLDLVRYADTVGYHGDQDHSIAPYREYVISAFNRNLPFDQFTREQLAGDLLPDPSLDQQIATGYNRLLQTSHEGGVQPREYLAIYAADRVRNLSAVWLGGTLGCAQCHDHKYDPYTSRDFYSMVAFFADVDEAQHFKTGSNSLPTRRPPEIEVPPRSLRPEWKQLQTRIGRLSQQLKDSSDDAEKQQLNQQLAALQKSLETIRSQSLRTMVTVSIAPREIRILPRGNWLDDTGEIVSPAVPSFLGRITSRDGRPSRLDLANWLVDAENGIGLLTARVFVNRFWYLMFGDGLSPILDDLGNQGSPPIAPELLDRLAHEFVESGWNVKAMFRLLANSHAYRLDSLGNEQLRSSDPQNQLLARQTRFRLPAEMIRDNALSISGLLVHEQGGRSVRPYQPAGYYRHLNFPTRRYSHDRERQQWRRGVYIHWQRQFLHPMLKAFDAPSREECTASRPRSNTPLAALTLLNDPTFLEAARSFALEVLRNAPPSDTARMDFAFARCVSRRPDDNELQILSDLLAASRKEFSKDATAASDFLQIGEMPPPKDLDPVEAAAWTMVARSLLNLAETNTRN